MLIKLTLAIAALVSVQAGKCPFGYGGGDSNDTEAGTKRNLQANAAIYPSEALTCSRGAATTTDKKAFNSVENYKEVVEAMIKSFDTNSKEDQKSYVACMVRLAGHDFMDFRNEDGKTSGGMDGCMHFDDPAHAGLPECLDKFKVQDVYEQFCHHLSLADFIVLATEATYIRTASKYDANNKFGRGTLGSRFMNRFKVGRKTAATCPENVGFMPSPMNGCEDLKKIFVDHLYGSSKTL